MNPLFGTVIVATALAALAYAVPALVPLGSPPLSSMHTEALALIGWGLWMAWLAPQLGPITCRFVMRQPGLIRTVAALAILIGAVIASVALQGLPVQIGLRHGAFLGAGTFALLTGAWLAASHKRIGSTAITALMWVVLLAGVFNACIGVLQYAELAGPWDPLRGDGRASGGLGQPNLLGTQLLWAYAGLAALSEQKRVRAVGVGAFAPLLLLGVAESASRSAVVSSFVLMAWGVADRRLKPGTRWLLVCAPIGILFGWSLLDVWQRVGGPTFAGRRLMQHPDVTSARWGVWHQCVALIEQHPWFGVGWGQFNFAWTLTPMPGLPRTEGMLFTHAHNLVLHWAVELGVPLTVLLLGLLAAALVRPLRRMRGDGTPPTVPQRAALAMVLVVMSHSQFEYPLWYAHFLLPALFLLGFCVTQPNAVTKQADERVVGSSVPGLLVVLVTAFALLDYRAVAELYVPPPDAAPEAERIAAARRSLLFGHFGDRLVGTLAPAGSGADPRLYRVVAFEMLDPRLMSAWALALERAGHREQALHVVARLREFDAGAGRRPFGACEIVPTSFHCTYTDPRLPFEQLR